MPAIEIRPVIEEDLPALVGLDHSYTSDWVWQMEISTQEEGQEGQVRVNFREVRLPRSVRVDYPRPYRSLSQDWQERTGLLAAVLDGEPVGYVSLQTGVAPLTAWASDVVVKRRLRRQGIGSALLLAAQEWGAQHDCRYLILEMQPKNHPAIHLARKLGFDFCGYNDRYYANHDIGLFFARALR